MAKEDHMAAHLTKAQALAWRFKNMVFIKVPRAQNNKAYRLTKLASSSKVPSGVHMEYLERKAIEEPEEIDAVPVQICKCWIDLIVDYLKDGALPEDKKVAKRIKYISNRYVIIEAALYRKGYVIPFLLCLHPYQA